MGGAGAVIKIVFGRLYYAENSSVKPDISSGFTGNIVYPNSHKREESMKSFKIGKNEYHTT